MLDKSKRVVKINDSRTIQAGMSRKTAPSLAHKAATIERLGWE